MARALKPPVRNTWANAASGSPDIVEAVYVDTGFPAPGGTPVKPPRGNVNFEFNRYDSGIVYLFQHGIPDWDTDETDYAVGDILRATDNKFYQLVGTATPGTAPTSDPANWYLVLRLPRPMPGESAVNAIWKWYNLQNNPVFGIDHFGFPTGKIITLEENWVDADLITGKTATGSGKLFGPWNYRLINGSGGTGVIAADGAWIMDLTTHPWGPLLIMGVTGNSAPASAVVELCKTFMLMGETSLKMEVELSVNGATPQSNTSIAVGFGDGTFVAGNSPDATETGGAILAGGAYLIKPAGSSGWQVKTKGIGGGSAGSSASSLSADLPLNYKVYVLGNVDGDGGTRRVIHCFNDTIVGNHTINMVGTPLTPFVRFTANGGPETCFVSVGRMRVQARLGVGGF